MNNFDKRFRKRQKQFDKDFKRIRTFAMVWSAFCFVLGMALLSGAIWVIYRLLLHFGIL